MCVVGNVCVVTVVFLTHRCRVVITVIRFVLLVSILAVTELHSSFGAVPGA